MKILLTGKNGQVGFELQRALVFVGEVIAIDYAECDQAAAAIKEVFGGVMGAELIGFFPKDSRRVGVDRSGAYSEDDVTNSQSIYGKTKLAGEQALQQNGAEHLIFRTSWVFGAHGGCFAKTMLRLAVDHDSLNVVAEQYGAPTSFALVANITAQIIGQYQKQGWLHLRYLQPRRRWHHHLARVRPNRLQAAHADGKELKFLPHERRLPCSGAAPTPGWIRPSSKVPSAFICPIGKTGCGMSYNKYSERKSV